MTCVSVRIYRTVLQSVHSLIGMYWFSFVSHVSDRNKLCSDFPAGSIVPV